LILTLRRLNRATLARQGLLRRQAVGAVDGVRRAMALQAQEAPSPYLALWNRIERFDPAELDRAFTDKAVVKAQLMRITLHAVAAEDYPAFHEAMQVTLRAARLNDARFRGDGITVEATEALVPDLLELTRERRTNAEVEAWLEARLGSSKPRVWWALRQYGPFVHAAAGGAWSSSSPPTPEPPSSSASMSRCAPAGSSTTWPSPESQSDPAASCVYKSLPEPAPSRFRTTPGSASSTLPTASLVPS